jgi:hypothetical protein
MKLQTSKYRGRHRQVREDVVSLVMNIVVCIPKNCKHETNA